MTCSKLLMGFVKRTFKDSHSHLVEKLVERAHILESNLANERLRALRNVEPRERAGHGDIFIAPPPDYQFAISHPYRAQASPRFSPHQRSQSASPILTPRLTKTFLSTERSSSVTSLPNQQERPSSSGSALHPKAASAPEQSLYLLPATTYDGGLSDSFNRPISLYPGSTSHPPSNRVVSLYYETMVDEGPSDDESDEEPEPVSSHVVSPPYIPEVRPISFNFAFDQKSPGPMTPISNEDLLADIDAAIDEGYLYSSSGTKYDALPTPNALQAASQAGTLPATTYGLLPSTTYSASPTTSVDTLPSTTYSPAPSSAQSPGPMTPISNEDLLADIDAAIDEGYLYSSSGTKYDALPTPNALQAASQAGTLPATTYGLLPSTTYSASPTTSVDTLPSTTYSPAPSSAQSLDTLPSTTYTPGPFLPSTSYAPASKHERKDSVMPYHAYSDLPPVPPKDEKYRRPSQVAV